MQILYRRTAIAEGARVRTKSMKQYKSAESAFDDKSTALDNKGIKLYQAIRR